MDQIEKEASTDAGEAETALKATDDSAAMRRMEIPAKKTKKRKKGVVLFACISAAVIFIALISSVAFKGDGYGPFEDYIATLRVEGTIGAGETDILGNSVGYQHEWTLDRLDDLMADEKNKGLIVFVNSPGGGVYESDELYLKLKEYKDTTGRPVYAAMGSMAASGGYYISAAADKIYANRNSWTGSIGVTMGTYFDLSGFLSRYGINSVTVTSGRNKSMGSMVEPMTEEQKGILQSLINEAYDQFTGIISEERGIGMEQTRNLADGRIYTAKQALKLGLIDAVGTMDDAVLDMQDNYGLNDCVIWDDVYQEDSLWSSLISGKTIKKLADLADLAQLSGGDVSAIMNIVEERSQFPISYMYEGM